MAGRLTALAAAMLALAGCGNGGPARVDAPPGQSARLTVAFAAARGQCPPGRHRLRVDTGSDAVMQVTGGASGGERGLLVLLHGSGGTWPEAFSAFAALLERPGMVLVATSAESRNWNFFLGADRPTIERALVEAFRRCRIDLERVGVAGFSDGAGAALTLALANGDVFRAVIAAAPGGLVSGGRRGAPKILITHGRQDAVIPIARARAIARQLEGDGYDVELREFEGGHEVPPDVSGETLDRLFG